MSEFWNSIDTLRPISQTLVWCSIVFAILAAATSGILYYVDQRINYLSAVAQEEKLRLKEKSQLEREKVLEEQVELAKQEQQEALDKLSKLEKRVQGRHLGSKEKNLMISQLKQARHLFGEIIVTAANSNQEAQLFGYEFVYAFREAGCKSDLLLPIPGLTPNVKGIFIGVRNIQNAGEEATALATVFQSSGIDYRVSKLEPSFFKGEDFILVIGSQ